MRVPKATGVIPIFKLTLTHPLTGNPGRNIRVFSVARLGTGEYTECLFVSNRPALPMKTLIILRHADAVDQSAGGDDIERPLTDLGREQAGRQGEFLSRYGVSVERIVASSARRVQETAVALAEAAGNGLVPESVESLYNAPGEVLLEYVRGLPDQCSVLLLVAHMPGVAQLASLLTTEHGDLDLIYSPGTMAAVQIEGNSWQDMDYGVGVLTLFLPLILPHS